MSVNRAAVRAKLASSMAAMLAQRTELLCFYSDADQILADACRRIDIAGRSAKKIAGVR